MPASQSSTASNLPATDILRRDANSDPKPDSTFTRSFPSPFSAPIQAARKYFERQRGDGWQSRDLDAEAARDREGQAASAADGASLRGQDSPRGQNRRQDTVARDRSSREQLAPEPSLRERLGLEEIRREQDRRLERSLYEGHATQTDPDSDTQEASTVAEMERGYLADADRSEPLPDPEVVRGAILRLSRESELHLADLRVSAGDLRRDVPSADAATHTAPARPVPSAQPLDFGDVARRVWGAHSTSLGPAEHGPQEPRDARSKVPEAAAAEAERKAAAVAAVDPRAYGDRDSGVSQVRKEVGNHALPLGTPIQGKGRGAPQSAVVPTQYQGTKALSQNDLSVSSKDAARTASGAGDGPSLAHDACNLLSALALYSELLASPGVLGEQHRHYAEELKLLAGRSQVLIDRLLRGGPVVRDELPPGGKDLAVVGDTAGGSFDDQVSSNVAVPRPLSDSFRRFGAAGRETALQTVSQTLPVTVPDNPRAASIPLADSARDPRKLADSPSGRATLPESAPRNGTEELAGEGHGEPAAAPLPFDAPQETVRASAPVSAGAPISARGDAEQTQATSLVHLLMRWGSLLSTLAHGRLEVVFGPHAATPVPAAAEALERILVNLVRNARAATAQGGAIRISVGAVASRAPQERGESAGQGDCASGRGPGPLQSPSQSPSQSTVQRMVQRMVLTVDDSGCGMTEEQVQRILGGESASKNIGFAGTVKPDGRDSRVTQMESTSEAAAENPIPAAKGLGRRRGLGLQIVRQLVAASGGSLLIQSRFGSGTRVEIQWPVTILPGASVSGNDERVESERTPPGVLPEASFAAPSLVVSGTPLPAAAQGVILTPEVTASRIAEASATPPANLRGVKVAADDVGPDGFSESDLRAMMLRLHRTGPQERGPLGRSLGEWMPPEVRSSSERQTNGRKVGSGEADRGFSMPESGALGPDIPGTGALGTGALGIGALGTGLSISARQERAAKGAIAC